MINKRYTVIASKTFLDEYAKLSDIHKKTVAKKITLLESNPHHPSLRTKKVLGNRKERYESSVNMDIRLIWRFDEENRMVIVMLDVGHHDV